VAAAIKEALEKPELRAEGIELAAATRDDRYESRLEAFSQDTALPDSLRVAAVEAIGTIGAPSGQTLLDRLIDGTKGRPNANPVNEAAVRTLTRRPDAANRLSGLIDKRDFPLGVRREALRTLILVEGGARRILDMAKAGKLPGDLTTEATTILHTAFTLDRRLRDEAARVLPLPKSASGRPLPPVGQLIRREGDPERGHTVFFRSGLNSCASCHRVRGQGQWVGPDLSTIGTKYGKDELFRSILNPSAAIGYNFRALILGLTDGRIVTGLPVEDTPDRLVIKTAQGQRVVVRPGDVEDRKTSDVSLMPEGLAQTMTDTELVDLLEYLSTLREPVSIAGQYHVIGPVDEPNGARTFDPAARIDLSASVRGSNGQVLSWRRLDANAEGLTDLSAMAADGPGQAIYVYIPVTSPVEQKARLVVDTPASATVWLSGRSVISSKPNQPLNSNQPREAEVSLPKGTTTLLIRLTGNGRLAGQATLVTTVVSAQPVSYSGGEASLSAR
jgi:putative heme-binding domain-containing protein